MSVPSPRIDHLKQTLNNRVFTHVCSFPTATDNGEVSLSSPPTGLVTDGEGYETTILGAVTT